jgi:hypothetical protein
MRQHVGISKAFSTHSVISHENSMAGETKAKASANPTRDESGPLRDTLAWLIAEC